ncbi:MAG: hypothetical protein RL653_727 [Pseudomonadota bacterium]|jgi:hypothetical protein
MSHHRIVGGALALALLGACREERPAPSLSSLAPAPLPSLPGAAVPAKDAGEEAAREALFEVAPAPVFGEPLPAGAVRAVLEGSLARVGEKPYALEDASARGALVTAVGKRVLLAPDADTFVAQVSGLLAALDDADVETWLLHPGGAVAYRLVLRDEAAFNAWLEEPVPGKVRIIQRADGLELSTNMGKVVGRDPNGPSIPVRGGKLDVAAERAGLEKIQERFKGAPDLCVMPSYGTELAKVATVMSGTFRAEGEGIFAERCLVYPRPKR